MSNGLHTQFGWITPPLPGLAPKANNEEEEKKREGGRGGERSKIQQSSQTHFLQGRGGGFIYITSNLTQVKMKLSSVITDVLLFAVSSVKP